MPSRDYPAVHGPPPDNAEIARQLDAFASLLELAGAGPYTARAYRRPAELIRATPAPVAELVREGRARELRGIGPGIDRRLDLRDEHVRLARETGVAGRPRRTCSTRGLWTRCSRGASDGLNKGTSHLLPAADSRVEKRACL
jgi:hypothetical protein